MPDLEAKSTQSNLIDQSWTTAWRLLYYIALLEQRASKLNSFEKSRLKNIQKEVQKFATDYAKWASDPNALAVYHLVEIYRFACRDQMDVVAYGKLLEDYLVSLRSWASEDVPHLKALKLNRNCSLFSTSEEVLRTPQYKFLSLTIEQISELQGPVRAAIHVLSGELNKEGIIENRDLSLYASEGQILMACSKTLFEEYSRLAPDSFEAERLASKRLAEFQSRQKSLFFLR